MRPSKYVPGARRLRFVAAPAALVTVSSAGLLAALAGSAQASTAAPPSAMAQLPVPVVLLAGKATAPAAKSVQVAPAAGRAPVSVLAVPAAGKAAVPVPAAPSASRALAPLLGAPAAGKARVPDPVVPAARTAAAATPPRVVVPTAAKAAVPVPVAPVARRLQAPATSVPLGTAGSFAVLAGSGITNTGATTIKGDVGSSPTPAETGFAACPAADCVTLTGANHTSPTPNDPVTVKAKIDLTTAYNYAAGQVSTQVATELANQRLVAGVYSSASGTFQMTGTLVLDGQNKTNGVWIFQTASTLVTGGTGNVSLIRGAQACDVFYQVGSAATLGAGSTLKGTILAHDTISLGNGVTVQGRLLAGEQASGAGAVTLIHDTIVSPLCVPTTPPSSPPNTPPTGTTPIGTTPTGTTPTGTTPISTTPTGTGTTPTSTTPTGVTPTGTTPIGTTGTTTTTGTSKPPSATTGVTPTAATPVGFSPRTPTTALATTGTPTGPAPAGTPAGTGPQVGQVPVGAVHAGDGSMFIRAGAGTGNGGGLLVDVLAVAVAGGAVTVAVRLRRRDS